MKTKVENMTGRNGRAIPNQFVIQTDAGIYFQSYRTMIAFKPIHGKTQLDPHNWDYSRTTSKYRNLFLGESKAETERKIKAGEYEMKVLN